MKIKYYFGLLLAATILFSCADGTKEKETDLKASQNDFEYVVEQFADLRILRYQIPGFEELTLDQKKLVYYLTQAGLFGRDIMYDQNYRHNLKIKRAFEKIYADFKGDRTTEEWQAFEVYLKRLWFSSGIHHHYSNDKFEPGFTKAYLDELLKQSEALLTDEAYAVIFDDKDAKKVNRDESKGLLLGSAINFYGPDVTAEDVDNFYKDKLDPNDKTPVELGLNSKLIKNQDGMLEEKIWKVGGMYSDAIEEIVGWLEKAVEVAENEKQAEALQLLIEYYRTGDLETWDKYNIAWATSIEGDIDYINGFIEVYNDPKAYRGSYESIVQIKDFDMSKKMAVLSEYAQWFEDNSTLI
jgi:dipeptidyl-peptidase-3